MVSSMGIERRIEKSFLLEIGKCDGGGVGKGWGEEEEEADH